MRYWLDRGDRLGALLTYVLTGWRIPFGIAAVLGLYALWIRVGITESDKFTGQTGSTPTVRETFRLVAKHRMAILRITGLTIGGVTVVAALLEEHGATLAPRI